MKGESLGVAFVVSPCRRFACSPRVSCVHSECDDPRLLRFKGRPFDLSPKARMKTWLG